MQDNFDNQLGLRTINSLRGESFFVPAYQRGYRWTQQQVTELLEDVWEFARSGARSRGEFYCLQPLVVAPRPNGGWEVVDGQQRLTTARLVLSHFNERKSEKFRGRLFGMSYDTRPKSAAFLDDVRPEDARENIDFFHMAGAAEAIQAWFSDRPDTVEDFEPAFGNSVQVIWYQVTQDTKPTEVFRRLNVGKIPLTEAELVKALFLRDGNFKGDDARLRQMRQLQIASEWDAMERRLQEDDFWYFLTNAHRESNRIELVLRLRATSELSTRGDDSLFHTFDDRLRAEGADAWSEWREVKRVFLMLEEWYGDAVLHHLIGFLATREHDSPYEAVVEVARLAAQASNKQQFRAQLKESIFRQIFSGAAKGAPVDLRERLRAELDDLDYNSDGKRVKRVLLLFNLVTLMDGSNVRFHFGAFKREDWDIEHIRSVASRIPERVDDQKAWLANVVRFFGGAENGDADVARATSLLAAEKFDTTSFRELFEKLRGQHDAGQDVDVDNSIGNLTLLDAETNRSYGNAMFPLKRARIIERDMKGGFVPPCTKNAFLKYYSHSVERMLTWNKADRQAHADAIVERLAAFFAPETTA